MRLFNLFRNRVLPPLIATHIVEIYLPGEADKPNCLPHTHGWYQAELGDQGMYKVGYVAYTPTDGKKVSLPNDRLFVNYNDVLQILEQHESSYAAEKDKPAQSPDLLLKKQSSVFKKTERLPKGAQHYSKLSPIVKLKTKPLRMAFDFFMRIAGQPPIWAKSTRTKRLTDTINNSYTYYKAERINRSRWEIKKVVIVNGGHKPEITFLEPCDSDKKMKERMYFHEEVLKTEYYADQANKNKRYALEESVKGPEYYGYHNPSLAEKIMSMTGLPEEVRKPRGLRREGKPSIIPR